MSKYKLLLADDSITIQKVVNLTFADEGIEVISVGDGNAAIEKLSEFTPDLVMADINMPGLSGYEICERIRANRETSRIPVILLVGSFEPFDEAEAERVGASDFLTKPFQSIRQLVTKVSGLLESADRTSTDEIISDLEKSVENKMPGEFENTLEMKIPEAPAADEFGDSGMDDEMIQTNQIGASEVQNVEIENDPRITQPLTTAEFDAIHRSADQERGYEFVSESSEDLPQEYSSFAETEPLPANDSFYQTQRVFTEPTIESEDDANLLELPPQRGSFSAAAYSKPVWQEEIAPIAEESETHFETEENDEPAKINHFAPTFEEEKIEETAAQIEPFETISPEPQTVEESFERTEAETVAEKSPYADNSDLREAPTDEMIDLNEVQPNQAETSSVAPQIGNLSPEVIDAIAAKVSEKFSDRVLRELVEELKPQITEMIAKRIAE